MGLDPLSPAAPARLRTLLVPAGHLRRSRFAAFVKRLDRDNIVRLGDVSPDSRPHRTLFSPLAFPEGLIVYDLSTAIPSTSHLALGPFELYRQPLLVVGVLDGCPENEKLLPQSELGKLPVSIENTESLQRILNDLKADFPSAFLHQLLIFDYQDNQGDLPEGVISVPSPKMSRATTIKTVMCDMTSRLLGEMTLFGKNVQSAPTVDTPKASNASSGSDRTLSALPSYLSGSSRAGSAASRSRSFSPVGDDSRMSHRMSLPAHIPSTKTSRSATPHSRAASPASGSHTPPATSEEGSNARHVPLPPSPQRPSQDRARNGSQDRSTRKHRSESIGDREKIKAKGRIGVVIGSMFLLAGRWPDAVKELVQSANITRSNSDYVWQAKALDYLLVCLLMYAWAGMDFRIPDILRPGAERPGSNLSKSTNHKTSTSLPEVSTPQTGDPAALLTTLQSMTELLPDIVNNILNLYSRAWTFTDDKIPPLSYSHSAIRLTKLLTAIRQESGYLNHNVLRRLVLDRPSQQSTITEIRPFMSASELSNLLFRAYPIPSENSMPLSERTNILAAIASVLSELGYHRKKAVVMKELLSALLPALVQARKDGAAEMGVHPAASLSSLHVNTGDGFFVEQSGPRDDDTEQEMGHFLILVCSSFGLVSQDRAQATCEIDRSQGTKTSAQETATSIANALQQASMSHVGSQDLKIDILRSCISICEALPNLAGALKYSAQLLKIAGSGIAPGPENSNGSPALPIEEQMRLANNISRTIGAAQHLGLRHPEANYWDEFLVRSIEHVESVPFKSLIPHAKSELEIVETIEAKKEKNPFIYNPFLKANLSAAVVEPTLVAEEEALFRVTLQNLYDFDLFIERLRLEADDIHFSSKSHSFMVGPYRTQSVLLGGTPRSRGSLSITGCLVKVRGCRERSFSNFREPWELKVDVKGGNIEPNIAAMEIGEREALESKSARSLEGPKASPLLLNVIAPQPVLQLTQICLPQSALMLLEGEVRNFTITIRNNSPATCADLVLLSFSDSTASRVQSALASKELSEAELYELELSTSRKQSFRWLRPGDQEDGFRINPREEARLEIEVLGKPGLSHGTIQVDYGYIGTPSKEIVDRFYTRQLKIPLAVTVNASVDLIRSECTALPSDIGHVQRPMPGVKHKDQNQSKVDPILTSHITKFNSQIEAQIPHILILLDFRNSWPSTLTLSLSLANETTNHPIPPGSTIRVPLPHPKIYLHPHHTHMPVPNLNPATARQFVLSSTSKHGPETELANREAFWYREELLKRLSATWVEEGTGRSGKVEMRALRLTSRMVSLLRLGDVDVSMVVNTAQPDLSVDESDPVKQLGAQTFYVNIGSFLRLRTTLRNRSDAAIRPLLRLQPTLAGQPHNIALDLGKKLLVNGILQRALPILKPGEETSVDTGFVVLSAGLYEWNACVEEVKATGQVEDEKQRARAKTGDNNIRGAVGRRVWYGEGPCVVVAEDNDVAM